MTAADGGGRQRNLTRRLSGAKDEVLLTATAQNLRRRERNVYICPGGKLLPTTGTVIDGGTLRYRASKVDCDVCAFKMRCCPSTPMRYVPRDLHEDARDVARALAKTEAYEQSRRERKKVEMRFAHMKRIFKLDRLRLRGGEVHCGWAGWRRGIFDRCEPDQGGRGQEEADAWRSAS